MGCDIHLVLEYRRRKEKVHTIEIPDGGNPITWTDGCEWQWCEIIPRFSDSTWSDRIYGMFAALAGVRDYHDKKLMEPRGIPSDITYTTLRHYADKVIPDDEYKARVEGDTDDGYVSESDAEDYIKRGLSEYIEYYDKRNPSINGKYCSGADWHTPSWCTVSEMGKAFNSIFLNGDGSINLESDYIEWAALLGAMKGYEASGEYECRAVFWFDN